jgi:hypothetical protein
MAAQIAASQTRELDGERAQEITDGVAEFERRFYTVICEGVQRREFMPYDAKVASFAILGALVRLTEWCRPDGRLSPEDVVEVYAGILSRGLLAPAAE